MSILSLIQLLCCYKVKLELYFKKKHYTFLAEVAVFWPCLYFMQEKPISKRLRSVTKWKKLFSEQLRAISLYREPNCDGSK